MTNYNQRVYGDLFEIRSGLVFKDALVSEDKFYDLEGIINGSGYTFNGFGCELDQNTYLYYGNVSLSNYTVSVKFKTDTLQDCLVCGSTDYNGSLVETDFALLLQADGTVKANVYNTGFSDLSLSIEIDYSDNVYHTITLINNVTDSVCKLFIDALSTEEAIV